MIKVKYSQLLNIVLLSGLLFSFYSMGVAKELTLPPMPPSIEELTRGKVKIGDVITENNVELVRDYLAAGLYEIVKEGMVLRMASGLPPEKLNPRSYLEATERNKGNAVLDDHMVVHLKDGSAWPGGIPFVEPKNAAEVMGYVRFGHGYDDSSVSNLLCYVDKNGTAYKKSMFRLDMLYMMGRLTVPPLGTIPEMEAHRRRVLQVFTFPLGIKGMGQLVTDYVDDIDNYDIGFSYLPAFKRTIRISTTTYQDNVGGSDITYGDGQGLREPFGSWRFKLLEKKFILVPEWVREKQPISINGGLDVDPQIEYDKGHKFPRLGWTINPVFVIEAIPKDTGHIYSKKILYVNAPYFAPTIVDEIAMVDIYDKSGELWKFYMDLHGGRGKDPKGETYTTSIGSSMYDLQTGHSTHVISIYHNINSGISAESLNVKEMLRMGR